MSKTKEPTWAEIIDAAKERGEFNEREVDAAYEWTSCACRALPDYARAPGASWAPLDPDLQDWGVDFYRAVEAHDFDAARELDQNIRARIAELYPEVATNVG